MGFDALHAGLATVLREPDGWGTTSAEGSLKKRVERRIHNAQTMSLFAKRSYQRWALGVRRKTKRGERKQSVLPDLVIKFRSERHASQQK